MYSLGIFGPGPNSSACLIDKNMNIVAWIEEERLNRIKTAPNSFPVKAISKIVKDFLPKDEEISSCGYAWDCINYATQAIEHNIAIEKKYPSESKERNILSQKYLNMVDIKIFDKCKNTNQFIVYKNSKMMGST